MSKDQSRVSVKWAAAILILTVVAIGVSVAALSLRPEEKVTDFDSCKAAGGAILEMYPEQCRINDQSFTNEAQVEPIYPEPTSDGTEYVGLTEEAALAKAKEANTPARVVERDGESLPVTMDFVFGRVNFYVKEGAVYKVEVEGQAIDSK